MRLFFVNNCYGTSRRRVNLNVQATYLADVNVLHSFSFRWFYKILSTFHQSQTLSGFTMSIDAFLIFIVYLIYTYFQAEIMRLC